ncbi:iron chaperone [Fulvivirga lutimaris]|uniref:iron chaperone n=1 Tax=Fulvivirga lutimaris TaxID=1819566 RepID=UPI0012BCC66C|nr:DUF1801 domain-containing protein [Fulvivirga lutimaris]MTI38136.1 hypothetical protein [Fulvivirga lutimaris]
MNRKPKDFDDYITDFPEATREKLILLREAIVNAAPSAEEVISYGMPAFKQSGMLVYLAGYEKYIGFYPTPSAILNFENKLKKFKTAKGTVHFPLNEPLPFDLIKEMVKFRVEENLAKAKTKKAK